MTTGIMTSLPQFRRHFFEHELPKLLKLTDTYGNLPIISLGLLDGGRVELEKFEIADEGLFVRASTGEQLVTYLSIRSLQVMPRSFKRRLANKDWPRINCIPLGANDSS